ncbi:MAG TPA: AraC family transcriptional regulator [Stellaceae bacterium]|nr:AraC family transcriptional regulator [Stellaceae bacterium]
MGERLASRLERSCRKPCGPSPGDWLRTAPPRPGLERIEAFFSGHAYDKHRHDTYAVGYTIGGVQRFEYRGSRVESTAGKLLVIHPDEAHNGRAGAECGFQYRMLYVQPRLIRAALGDGSGLPFVPSALSTDARLMRALCFALADLDSPLEDLAADQAVLSLAEALRALDPSAAARASSPACAVAVERARQFLDAHLDRTVASTELETVTGLDRYALARHFRTLLGTSPYRYLTMRRLDRARALIRTGHAISDAAYASGFADQSHMTRQFKQAFGLPPGRWRAAHRPR